MRARRPHRYRRDVSARHRLLLVHAHPDDETLATGGTMARYAADADTSVTLVTCTLGERGRSSRPSSHCSARTMRTSSGATASASSPAPAQRSASRAPLPRWYRPLAGLRDGARRSRGARHRPRAAAPARAGVPDALADQVDALTTVLEAVPRRSWSPTPPTAGTATPTTCGPTRSPPRRCGACRCTAALRSGRRARHAGRGVKTLADVPGLPFRPPGAGRAAQRARRDDHRAARRGGPARRAARRPARAPDPGRALGGPPATQ